ncbi:MAG: FkbM family methyltransferase [Clostridia bacterium]|nr:FkbM family methyltransferase [Clostridia bacterium]
MHHTDIWTRLREESRPVVLYGTGNGADRVIDILERENIKISGIFSSAAFVRDRFFRGYKVTDFESCKKEFPDMLVLMCFGSTREDVLENVKKISRENELLAPDVPVYGDNIFDLSFYKDHKNELDIVGSRLADEKSLDTFRKLVDFKLSGNINNLFSCEYDNSGIFDISDDAVYFDLGAYNGDTVTEFAEKYKYGRIIAVEPDRRNFRKLSENTQRLSRVKLYNALISDKNETVFLDNNKGRGTHESEKGKIPVEAVTIDKLAEKEKLSEKGQLVIKFDVEGNELKALSGAQDTIKKYSPLMFISCYHRSEDYFTIPLKVFSINDNYKLYMRHYKGIPAWETEYIFVPKMY